MTADMFRSFEKAHAQINSAQAQAYIRKKNYMDRPLLPIQ